MWPSKSYGRVPATRKGSRRSDGKRKRKEGSEVELRRFLPGKCSSARITAHGRAAPPHSAAPSGSFSFEGLELCRPGTARAGLCGTSVLYCTYLVRRRPPGPAAAGSAIVAHLSDSLCCLPISNPAAAAAAAEVRRKVRWMLFCAVHRYFFCRSSHVPPDVGSFQRPVEVACIIKP